MTILLVILLGICIIVLLILVALVLNSSKKKENPSQDLINIAQQLSSLKTLLGTVENSQRFSFADTIKSLENIRQEALSHSIYDKQNQESLKILENIIAGTKSKGIAGENILAEVLKQFPPEMVVSPFKIRGGEVEFGFILPDKKILPIDSKWPSTNLMENISKEENPALRQKFLNDLEKEVLGHASTVAKYIDPNSTTPFAVCALPDAVFSIIKKAHLESYKRNIILISYSTAVPYLLTLFNMQLRSSSSIDMDNLNSNIMDLKRHLDNMSIILENKLETAIKMASNATLEYRQMIGLMKNSINILEYSKK